MGRYVKNPVLVAGSSTGGSNVLPIGTTSQRPATASAGTMRYNSTLNMLEFHNGTEYVQLRGAVNGQHLVTKDQFTIAWDGSTTNYQVTLSLTPKHERNILVFLEGVFQPATTSYTVSSNVLSITIGAIDNNKKLVVLHGFDFV